MIKIKDIQARQVLDSRGNPTVEANILLNCGTIGRGISPSGASTGRLEALELRDNDAQYLGKSVLKATNNINDIIKSKIVNQEFDQSSLDELLIDIDGTNNKSKLGANATLAVSLAFAHASSYSKKLPLYETFSDTTDYSLPVPMMNILNGGAHANNGLDFQEFMILPIGFNSFADSLRSGVEIFHTLKGLLDKQSLSTAVGDEGGFAPALTSNSQALDLIVKSIEQAGYSPGIDVYLGLDVASSEFYKNGRYILSNGDSYNNLDFVLDHRIAQCTK